MTNKNLNLKWKNISLLVLIHTFIIGLSNYLLTIPIVVLGLTMTWSAFSFPLIVVATDLTIRLINKQNARAIIGFAFIPAILTSVNVIHFTGTPWEQACRIGFASACSFGISNLCDIFIFQKVRERFTQWWAAPFGSSVLANVVDTFTFFSVAFHNSSNQFMSSHWPTIALNQTGTKIVISTLVVLPIYGILLKSISKIIGRNISGKIA